MERSVIKAMGFSKENTFYTNMTLLRGWTHVGYGYRYRWFSHRKMYDGKFSMVREINHESQIVCRTIQ
jgi:hypothetical protein